MPVENIRKRSANKICHLYAHIVFAVFKAELGIAKKVRHILAASYILAEALHILIAAYLVSHYSYFLKCAAQLPMDNVIHKFIEGLLILKSLHAHIFNAFLFVNTDRENAEWDTLKIC